jgi:hypothetical protein
MAKRTPKNPVMSILKSAIKLKVSPIRRGKRESHVKLLVTRNTYFKQLMFLKGTKQTNHI